MWIDTAALDHLCQVTQSCPVFDPTHDCNPPFLIHFTSSQLELCSLLFVASRSVDERLGLVLAAIYEPSSDGITRLHDACAQPASVGDRFLK